MFLRIGLPFWRAVAQAERSTRRYISLMACKPALDERV
jgi:hypothetical protein